MGEVVQLREAANVVGIDTASNRMHWASTYPIGEDGGLYGFVTCSNDNPDRRRLELLAYSVAMASALAPGTHVFCEEPLALQNGKTTRLLGLAAGAVWSGFNVGNLDIFWHWVDQSKWKKEVLGRGIRPRDFGLELPVKLREKTWIASEVSELTNFKLDIATNIVAANDFARQPDLYDAYAIRTYGAREIGKLQEAA